MIESFEVHIQSSMKYSFLLFLVHTAAYSRLPKVLPHWYLSRGFKVQTQTQKKNEEIAENTSGT